MLFYWIVVCLAWVVFRLLFRVEIIGRENLKAVQDRRPLVVAPNHVSMFDPVFVAIVLMDMRRLIIPAKEELFKNKILGWAIGSCGALAIDRGKGDTTALDYMTTECKKGRTVLIFPEGTRTKTGKLGMLKGGAFVIAGAAGADMLPCRLIYGTKDGKLHLFCRVRVCFGPAIPAAELQITDPKRKVAALRKMKNRLKGELETLYEANCFPEFDPPVQPEIPGAPEQPAAPETDAAPHPPTQE